jgi:hypothetical protein
VAAVGYLSHRARLPLGCASRLSGYPDKASQPSKKGLVRGGDQALSLYVLMS